MHLLPFQSPVDGLLGSSGCSSLTDVTIINNVALASFLTNANLSAGWIPRSGIMLAYLWKKKSMLGWFSFLKRGVHGSADPEGSCAIVYHYVRIKNRLIKHLMGTCNEW